MGERNNDPEMEDLRAVAERWDIDPVHPVLKEVMGKGLMEELERPASAFTNRGTKADKPTRKRQRVDMSEHWQSWVTGCTATLTRNDTHRGGGRSRPPGGGWRTQGGVSAGGIEGTADAV
jgi:hypothetical protein